MARYALPARIVIQIFRFNNSKIYICQITLPPIRSKSKSKTKVTLTKQNGSDIKSKRIKSFDYCAWDKFDAVSFIYYTSEIKTMYRIFMFVGNIYFYMKVTNNFNN